MELYHVIEAILDMKRNLELEIHKSKIVWVKNMKKYNSC